MYRTAALAILALAQPVASTLEGHGMEVRMGEPMAPGFQGEDVRYSVCMYCGDNENSACFMNNEGVFNRANYDAKLIAAYNKVAAQVRREYMDVTTEKWIQNTDAGVSDFQSTLSAGQLKWERVVERTSPFRVGGIAIADALFNVTSNSTYYETRTVTQPDWWNVCIRQKIADVPKDMAHHMTEVLTALEAEYNAASLRAAPVKVQVDSAWVEPLAYFITNQLEPVPGRGHKDQRLLLPLLLGVFAMLFVPIMLTFFATTWAQGQKKYEDEHELQEKVIKYMEDKLAYKTSHAEQLQTNVTRFSKIEADEQEMRRLNAERQYEDKDMDWSK